MFNSLGTILIYQGVIKKIVLMFTDFEWLLLFDAMGWDRLCNV